jgi:hypothetical protein
MSRLGQFFLTLRAFAHDYIRVQRPLVQVHTEGCPAMLATWHDATRQSTLNQRSEDATSAKTHDNEEDPCARICQDSDLLKYDKKGDCEDNPEEDKAGGQN